jgi:hypothetical protein
MSSPSESRQAALQRTITYILPTVLIGLSAWMPWVRCVGAMPNPHLNAWNSSSMVVNRLDLGPPWITLVLAISITVLMGLDSFRFWKSPPWLPNLLAAYGFLYTVSYIGRLSSSSNADIGSGLLFCGLGFLSFLLLFKSRKTMNLAIYGVCLVEMYWFSTTLISKMQFDTLSVPPIVSQFMTSLLLLNAVLILLTALIIFLHEARIFKIRFSIFNSLIFLLILNSAIISFVFSLLFFSIYCLTDLMTAFLCLIISFTILFIFTSSGVLILNWWFKRNNKSNHFLVVQKVQ